MYLRGDRHSRTGFVYDNYYKKEVEKSLALKCVNNPDNDPNTDGLQKYISAVSQQTLQRMPGATQRKSNSDTNIQDITVIQFAPGISNGLKS